MGVLRRLWGMLFTARKTASGKMRGNMVYLVQRRDAPVLVYMSLMDSTDDRTKFERVYQSYKGLMFYTANRESCSFYCVRACPHAFRGLRTH